MRVENTNLHLTPYHFEIKKTQSTPQQQNLVKDYNPAYYRDFNINFTARLFRTPANFYEQEFNRKGMPLTMKEYLFEDYEDRQNMPPNQMLKLVFADIKSANSLDEVKKLYPEEPLFANLSSTQNKKARAGVLAELDLMRADDKSLFKNGKDDLGLYLLEKIYLEGKTLKEINTDFQKDISVYYKGLSPIDYSTLSSFGIKYPNISFWKSFIATREDFPYEYKPRKAIAPRVQSEKSVSVSDFVKSGKVEKKKFDKVKDWEIDKLSDALIRGNGSQEETKRQLKKRNISNVENLNFVTKYLSEINEVVLERVHASDEMKDFFENYDRLSSTQKTAFDAYWQSDPMIRELRSMVMKDTIKLFMDAYGVDGNNEEFKELLDYAHSIKPDRLNRQQEHNKIQAEYDEMFANLPENIDNVDVKKDTVVEKEYTPEEIQKLLEEETIKAGGKLFKFTGPDGKEYNYVFNVNEEFERELRAELELLPDAFVNRYVRFMLNSPLATEKYKTAMALVKKVPESVQKELMKDVNDIEIWEKINEQFQEKYKPILLAGNQAFAERIIARTSDEYALALGCDLRQLVNFASGPLKVSEWTPDELAQINKDYQDYLQPIKDKESLAKINKMLVDYLVSYNKDIAANEFLTDQYIKLLSANIQRYPEIKSVISKVLRQSKFIEEYGGTAKFLLKDNISPKLREQKCKLIIEDFVVDRSSDLYDLFAASKENVQKYVTNPQLKMILYSHAMKLENSKR